MKKLFGLFLPVYNFLPPFLSFLSFLLLLFLSLILSVFAFSYPFIGISLTVDHSLILKMSSFLSLPSHSGREGSLHDPLDRHVAEEDAVTLNPGGHEKCASPSGLREEMSILNSGSSDSNSGHMIAVFVVEETSNTETSFSNDKWL